MPPFDPKRVLSMLYEKKRADMRWEIEFGWMMMQ